MSRAGSERATIAERARLIRSVVERMKPEAARDWLAMYAALAMRVEEEVPFRSSPFGDWDGCASLKRVGGPV